MLAVAVIVFREVLEAALVVGIVLAASQGVQRRGRWVTGGIACGVLVALTVAGRTAGLERRMDDGTRPMIDSGYVCRPEAIDRASLSELAI